MKLVVLVIRLQDLAIAVASAPTISSAQSGRLTAKLHKRFSSQVMMPAALSVYDQHAQSTSDSHPDGFQPTYCTCVIRSTEQGHKLSVCEEFVTFLCNLMSSCNKVEIKLLQEFGNDVWAESISATGELSTLAVSLL